MVGRAASNPCPSLATTELGAPWLSDFGMTQQEASLEGEIRALTSKAMGWAVSHLDEFDPFKGGRTFEMRHGQKLAELAMMVHAYVELTGDAGPQVRQILDLLRSAQRSRELCDRLMRAPAELILYCILYVVLRSRGFDDPAQRELLQRAIDAGFLDRSERVVHRQMDVGLHLEWGGFKHNWPSPESLYDSSILAHSTSPLYLDENAIYALTHILMFVYGFGLRSPATPAAETEAVRRMLSLLLVASCQEHHWDLLVELLLCWDCVGFEVTPIYEASWRALLGVQREDGAIPGPESALPDVKAGVLGDFGHHYHTTLVSIIAGALHARRSGEPRKVAIPAPRPADRERTHDIVTAARRARGWMTGLLESPGARQADVLCRILLGCWICDSILGDSDVVFPATAQRIARELVELEDSSESFESVPATLKLLAAGLLSVSGIEVPSLDEFALLSGECLREESALEPALAEKRLLCHALGLCPAPAACSEDLLEIAERLPLTASRDEVERFALELHAMTGFGTRCRPLAPAQEWIAEMIAGLATHCLRQYDFLTACKLLRALVYLEAAGGEAYDSCVDFLLLNQRVEGPFGFFGPEEGKLRNTQVSVDLDLYLPVTVSCLWVLAEGSRQDWRLYANVPRCQQNPQS